MSPREPVCRPSGRERKSAVRVFSVPQVAKMCHVSRETIHRWMHTHGLHAYNTQHKMDIKILETDLREFSERLKVYVDWESMDLARHVGVPMANTERRS